MRRKVKKTVLTHDGIEAQIGERVHCWYRGELREIRVAEFSQDRGAFVGVNGPVFWDDENAIKHRITRLNEEMEARRCEIASLERLLHDRIQARAAK